jgi:hydrogenase maturation factor
MAADKPLFLVKTVTEIDNFHCITCADEAVQVQVVKVNPAENLAVVELNGAYEEIDVTLIEVVQPGDILLAHGGVALAKI